MEIRMKTPRLSYGANLEGALFAPHPNSAFAYEIHLTKAWQK
jgi:hypothetical protein